MKLSKAEEQERILFVMETVDKDTDGQYAKFKDEKGFPYALHNKGISSLYLFSTQTDGKKAVYCGVNFGLIHVELTKEQIENTTYIIEEVTNQTEKNKANY